MQRLAITVPKLTKEEVEVLDHTANRAARQMYCGYSDALRRLCTLGLMRFLGRVSFTPDPYYTITEEGLKVLGVYKSEGAASVH